MGNRWGVSLALGLVLTAGGAVWADDQADMKKLVAQAIKAAGGEAKLAKQRAATMKFKGKIYFMGEAAYTAETSVQYPNLSKVEVSIEINGMPFTVVIVINKDKGWIKEGDKTMAMDKDRLAEEKEAMYVRSLAGLVLLKGKGFTLSPVGEVKVGAHEAVGLKVSHKGHRDVNLYFDKKTHLLVKSETVVKQMGTDKDVSQETYYSDYKDKEGIKLPMKIKIKQDGKKFVDVDEVTDFKLEEKLDESVFAKP
jgi:hypothetical protein